MMRSWRTGGTAASGPSGIPADNFSARMTGYLSFPTAGTYTLQTGSDDSTTVYVDDVEVLT